MIETGRVCIKICGRDAGKRCIIVEILDKNYVLIDGETRRRKCNIAHLEPLQETISLKEGATHEEVLKAFGMSAKEKKTKTKTVRPRKQRKGSKATK